MIKVAKLYQEPEQSLIPPFKEMNSDDIADKSLSRAFEQPVTQLKAPTDLQTKKKKISSSSRPKPPYKVRVIPPKKQVVETQHAEVTVATADATKSLKASELVKEQENQPSTTKTKKEPEKIVKMEEDAEDKSIEILTVEQLLDEVDKQNKVVQEIPESPYDTESEIKEIIWFIFVKKSSLFTQSLKPWNLLSFTKSRMESMTTLVKSGMKEVKNDLKSQAKSLGKFCLDVQSMQNQLNNIQSLLESAVTVDDTTEGEKNKKAKAPNPVATQGEPQSAKPLVESQREQPADLNVVNKESAPPASDAKLNKGKELVVHNSEEKKSEGIISVEDDSDEDDKKEATMKITRGDNPLNLVSLRAKFQWVINQAKRLGLNLSPKLTTLGLTAEEKKRKRTELIKEVFVTENVRVDGMDRNMIHPLVIMPTQGLVINEPES
nr:hypothetical protein [Tanacetum cinerariifolium]